MRHSTRPSKHQQLLVHRARLLRGNLSWPEQVLWKAIRSGQLGVPFRRQVPLGCSIVDFVAPRAKLIVEVDGGSHRFKQSADARRDRKLARLGYRVLRLEAGLVLKHLPFALQRIRELLRE